MTATTLIAARALSTGCASQKNYLEIVAVPIECREAVPARPVMPTEALRPGVSVDDFARAATAEIERREGYEGELLTALENCRKPVSAETVAETMRKPS